MVAFRPMGKTDYYSVRMLSQREGEHHSGAEMLVPYAELDRVGSQLIHRALNHSRGEADQLRLTIEQIPPEEILRAPLPEVFSWECRQIDAGRELAASLLAKAGASPAAIKVALASLAQGAAGGGHNMRGAMLIDAVSGGRLEPDYVRGVRVSRMGLSVDAREPFVAALNAHGLTHSNTREAIVLAAKVMHSPDVIAELCWSDDPDYVTGYVCAASLGYHRITPMKPVGDRHGGRAFFIRSGQADLSDLMYYLEKQPVLFQESSTVHAPQPWESPGGSD